jgi:hypothetical protein
MSGSRAAAVLALVCWAALGIHAAEQKKEQAPYALVAGTVFRDPGLALPGAKVVLTLRGDPKAKKLAEEETNYRGEFVFRVPQSEATYVVKASMKGYHPEEKEATISGPERIDVNLVLSPESK